MAEPASRFELDFSSNSCRIRIDGTKPGKFVKVLVKDKHDAAAKPLHGLGVLSEDSSVFTATFPVEGGEHTLTREWPKLRAELAKYPRYD